MVNFFKIDKNGVIGCETSLPSPSFLGRVDTAAGEEHTAFVN